VTSPFFGVGVIGGLPVNPSFRNRYTREIVD